jgi:hypothetical protein
MIAIIFPGLFLFNNKSSFFTRGKKMRAMGGMKVKKVLVFLSAGCPSSDYQSCF